MWADPPSPARIRAAAEAARRVVPSPVPIPDGAPTRSGRRRVGGREGEGPSDTGIQRHLDGDLDPAVVASILEQRPGFCWLDGDRPRLYVEPVAVLESRSGSSSIRGAGGREEVEVGGFDLLEGALEAWGRTVGVELVGHLGYELAGELEALPPTPPDDTGIPDLRLGLYDTVLRTGPGGWELVATRGWREPGDLEELIDGLIVELEGAGGIGDRRDPEDPGTPASSVAERVSAETASGSGPATPLRSRPDRRGYVDAVARSVARIRDGELFQVNLCRRLEVSGLRIDPLDLYLAWRGDRPAHRAAFVSLDDGEAILSASPETFLRVREDRVTTRPIKGTRPRGDTDAADRALVEELLASSKDRAELSMIVDLMRNDLGRVCRTGTVRVNDHFRAFRLPTVHHTASTVSGRLRSDVGPAGLLRATFPAGSITGAPKIRAMEIIAEEEERRRGPAMGAIGRISPAGDLDLSVAIRTAARVGDRLVYHAGAGIVADSDPEGEWHETGAKALGFLAALGLEGRVDEGAAVP